MAGDESFKAWFKQRRKSLDLTQDELARRAGCSIYTVQRIEEGVLRPSRQMAELLAASLEIALEQRPVFVQWARASRGRPAAAAAAPALAGALLDNLPMGTVTFLGTDIEGSTQRREQHPAAMKEARAQHDALLRAAIAAHGGQVVPTAGDSFIAAFATAAEALAAALAAQRALQAAPWTEPIGSLGVRMALHTGQAELRADGWYAAYTLNRLARLLAAGHGRQVLLSDLTRELLRESLPADLTLRDLGEYRLKDLLSPLHVYQVLAPDLPGEFPPLKSLDLALGTGDGSSAAVAEPENPYKGLRAFQEADAPDFFGRQALTARLLARLAEDVPLARFLAVVGPSGAGKSSVVRAGLIPALRRVGLPEGRQPVVVDLIPGPRPLEELEAALLRVAVNPPPSLLEQLRADERGLARAVKRVLPAADASELLLVIDQFEELFTLVPDEQVRADFLDSLFSAVSEPRSRLWVVITLRADFYDRPLLYLPSSELLSARTEVVGPLTADEMHTAITGPAARVGLELESGLVAAILQDVAEQPGALPLVQYTLTELFERREGRWLTLEAYRASGGVFGSLARRAESLYADLTDQEQEEARQLFLRLVTLGEGVEDTRRRVLLAEVLSAARQEEALRRVLEVFGRYRMLTFDRDPLTGGTTVEVAHEALLHAWGRLREWLSSSREALQVQRRLMASAVEWQRSGQETSFLASGVRLAQFAGLAAAGDVPQALALTAEEQAYLEASLVEQQHRETVERERQSRELGLQRRATNRLRYLVGGLAVFLLLAAALAAWALQQTGVAQANEQLASTNLAHADALRLGAEANSLLLAHGDGQLVALLAIRSLKREYSAEADAALSGAAILTYPLRRLPDLHGPNGLAISPDGKYLAVANGDKTVTLWDAASGQVVRELSGHGEVVLRASFSPDGKYLASASFDNTARLWDVATGQMVRIFSGHQGWVTEAVFSSDARYLATSSADHTVRLWNVATGQTMRTFTGHTAEVWDVVFSPDGKYLFTGSADKTSRLWAVATGQTINVMEGHTDIIDAVAYSPDGHYLASAGDDKTVRLWDAATGKPLWLLSGATAGIQSLAFSPDSKYLLSGGDATARLWEVASGRLVRLFAGHTNNVNGVAFMPDGQRIATSSFDSSAMLWPVLPAPGEMQFAGHEDSVEQANFSPDGKRVVTASDDHTARIWDAMTGRELVRLSGHDLALNSAVFSPDGKTILTASSDKSARVWDAATGKQLLMFPGQDDGLAMAVFSPDGKYAIGVGGDGIAYTWDAHTGATLLRTDEGNPANGWGAAAFAHKGNRIVMANYDGTAYIRDPLTGKNLQILRGHVDQVRDAVFSPDDKYVLTGSSDDTARLWDAQSGKELRRFTGHSGPVRGVAFSPNGRYALTGGDDETARLWDVQSGTELRRFSGHNGPVTRVAFAPDGMSVLTASTDKTARLWHTDYHSTISYLCGLLIRDLTADERTQYGITDPGPTCLAH